MASGARYAPFVVTAGILLDNDTRMEGTGTFIASLTEALENKRAHLTTEEIPQLKEQFRLIRSSFETLTNVLQRKHLLAEDPYKYEDKISDVEVPEDHPFSEFERDDQMSIRLSRYDSLLEYLVNYYEFSVESIDLKRLKTLLGFVSFIRWEQFGPQSQSPTTRGVADLVQRVRAGNDNLSTNIANDAVEQLSKATRSIKQILRSLADFHKEDYKRRLRERLLSTMAIAPEEVMSDRDSVVQQVRRNFASAMPGEPFVSDLVAAALDEDYSTDADALHEAVLRKLEVKPAAPKRSRRSESNRELLLEAIRAASAAARPLLDSVAKLNDNNALTQQRHIRFGERLRRFFQRISGGSDNSGRYEVEYFDETTGAQHTETIDYTAFVERVTKKAKFYTVLSDRLGAAARRLEHAPEDQVYEFVNKDLSELHVVHRRLKSLDTFFKSEVPRDQRGRLRGIKIELTTIKNHLIKANQKRHEYVARREEAEQLKRLGIDVGE